MRLPWVPSTQYFYRVVAFNRAGDSAPAAASVTTPNPAFNPVIVYTFNEGIMLERLSGIEDGHRELLDWIEGWLREREERAR